jgi:hypothetical protein
MRGEGVTQDSKESASWFRLAADQGNAGAQYYLGLAYATGMGVQQDYVQALKWVELAREDMSQRRQELDQLSYDLIENLKKHMTPSQIEESHQLARNWTPGSR